MQHLVIGNGPAGVIAADTRRKYDPGVVVICATGVKPKIAYLEGAGVRIGELGGIAVDRHRRTNLPGVFAAGDCKEAIHRLLDRKTLSQCDSARRWLGARHIARFPVYERAQHLWRHLLLFWPKVGRGRGRAY